MSNIEIEVTKRNAEMPLNAPAEHVLLPRVILGRWLDFALCVLGIIAIWATVILSLRLLSFQTETTRIVVGGVVTIIALLTIYTLRRMLWEALETCFQKVAQLPLIWIFIIGLMVRIVWIMAFPAQPGSDGSAYMSLAQRLIESGEYKIAGTSAYWPPGYPLILAGWKLIFSANGWAYWTLNIVLFGVMFTGVVTLTKELIGLKGAKFAGMLLAVWPNYVTSVATPEKELVISALLPWAFLALILVMTRNRKITLLALGVGVLVGVCTLVQPSIQLLLPVIVVFILCSRSHTLANRMRLSLLIATGALLVISPWTYRNYQVFDSFLLVSSNGGSNFYRANNDLATGGYTERGSIDLSPLSELDQNKEGMRLAKEWIKSNPIEFMRLIPEKQIRFMGDDATGVYTTLKIGGISVSSAVYATIKSLSNFWWISIWCLFILVIGILRTDPVNPLARLLIWPWLYLFFIHSIFESGGKYHIPALWVLPCLMAAYLETGRKGILKSL